MPGFGGFNSRGGGGSYGAGGSYGFNPSPSAGTGGFGGGSGGGSGWQATANSILPWLMFAYGIYSDRQQGDGSFKPVPQTPEQKEMYDMARQELERMRGNNQAAFNLALPGAMAAPGKVDMAAMRRGEVGYTGPQTPSADELARILASGSTSKPPAPTGTGPTGTPPGTTPSGAGTPPGGPGAPNTPNPNAPPPSRGPGFETPGTNPYASISGFGRFLQQNGIPDGMLIASAWFQGGSNSVPQNQRATISDLWQKYLATLPQGKPNGG